MYYGQLQRQLKPKNFPSTRTHMGEKHASVMLPCSIRFIRKHTKQQINRLRYLCRQQSAKKWQKRNQIEQQENYSNEISAEFSMNSKIQRERLITKLDNNCLFKQPKRNNSSWQQLVHNQCTTQVTYIHKTRHYPRSTIEHQLHYKPMSTVLTPSILRMTMSTNNVWPADSQ